MRVIDCQTHLHSRAFFEAHVGRRDYPRAERDGDGYLFHTSNGHTNPIPRRYWDHELQLEELEADGIDAVVSSMGAFTVDHLPVEQAVELAMHINEERADIERRFPDRFHALALVPMQDAQGAIRTVDHAIETLGMCGVGMASNVIGQSIATPGRRPIFRRIAELGVPVFLHPTRTVSEDRLRRYGHEYTVGFMVDSTVAALDLIFSGVLDDCPTLEVVHPHVGGVLPYLAGRVDVEHAHPWSGTEPLDVEPSSYLARFYTDTVSATPGALALALDTYEPERILFSSDYPYWSPRHGLEFIRDNLAEDRLPAVLAGNAARLLGLP